MSISIKDIARVAGVSHSTVSRALGDSPLVREETRERIQALAREMGYSPDLQARALVLGRTRTLGVVVTSIADPFVAAVVQGIEDAAHGTGYSVILSSSNAEPRREIEAVELLRAKRVDLVIVLSSRLGALYLEHLERIGAPVVLINSHSEDRGPYTFSVTVDNRHGGYLATRHLLVLGHRRIAYISGQAHHSDDRERLAGYRHALEEGGAEADPRLVILGDGDTSGGQRALPELWAHSPRPSAVFCYNDRTAIGLIHAARQAGMRLPDDLAIVGFDDIPFASFIEPALTTIAQPMRALGQRAVEMGLALLDERGQEQAPPADNVVLRGQLIVRASCGASPSQRACAAERRLREGS
jgi:DNA-binding LacI/PurR family transcriptional regulator